MGKILQDDALTVRWNGQQTFNAAALFATPGPLFARASHYPVGRCETAHG